MSILDELTIDDLSTSSVEKIIEQAGDPLEGNVGDICYYDVVNRKFDLASATDPSKIDISVINDWISIVIGVALNQYEDTGLFDIMMSGFLMKEPMFAPSEYLRKSKRKFIRAWAHDMFRRYVSAFFKKCPGYEDLLNLEITMPTIDDMVKIQKNAEQIFDSLRVVTTPDEFVPFFNRLFDNFIYVRHTNKKIYQMRINMDNPDAQPDIRVPAADIKTDFLCVFRKVDVFGRYFSLKNNLASSDGARIKEGLSDELFSETSHFAPNDK